LISRFWNFSRKRLAALKVRQAMHELCVAFWVFVMNRLAARVTPPGGANTFQKH